MCVESYLNHRFELAYDEDASGVAWHTNSARAKNGNYFRFIPTNTFDRRLILRPTAKVGRIYPINLMTDIVGVAPFA